MSEKPRVPRRAGRPETDAACRAYAKRFGHHPVTLSADGTRRSEPGASAVDGLPVVIKARAHALREAFRWGEPYLFFVAPGVLSWMVPLLERNRLAGGRCGGGVLIEDDPADRAAAVNYLVQAGCARGRATAYLAALPVWTQERALEASQALFEGAVPADSESARLLATHRENALQQRQIAEEIHRTKTDGTRRYSFDEERMLLPLIRVGDKPGARRHLNKMLAAMFLTTPRVVVVQARAMEMMGYLVRTAVEDRPLLEPLLEKHLHWIERIVQARDFERLCQAVREALDEFVDEVARQGFNRTNVSVRKALDYLAAHYAETVRLQDVADHVGLSTFRLAHLIKDTTGKTLVQHLKRIRIEKARDWLENTDRAFTEIAYALGFSDQSHFIRQFKDSTGATPARYRRFRLAPPPAGT